MNCASLMVVEVRCVWKALCELCRAPQTVATELASAAPGSGRKRRVILHGGQPSLGPWVGSIYKPGAPRCSGTKGGGVGTGFSPDGEVGGRGVGLKGSEKPHHPSCVCAAALGSVRAGGKVSGRAGLEPTCDFCRNSCESLRRPGPLRASTKRLLRPAL